LLSHLGTGKKKKALKEPWEGLEKKEKRGKAVGGLSSETVWNQLKEGPLEGGYRRKGKCLVFVGRKKKPLMKMMEGKTKKKK